MGVRELINQHRVAAGSVVGVLILICIVWIARNASPSSAQLADQAYFTIDDGANYFAADAKKLPPFTHEGKEAVKAYVFDCKGTRTVHYMERYTAAGLKAATEANEKAPPMDAAPTETAAPTTEYKRPGEATWQPNPPGPKPCPDGSQPEWVTP